MVNESSTRQGWANPRLIRFVHPGLPLNVLLWLTFFLFYAATTAQDILPADSGEFQLVAARWGIAHPPGYPLYTMVSALWTHLIPVGTLPFRTSLLSAVLAATTLVLTYQAVRLWAEKSGFNQQSARFGALTAVLLLGTAGTFWAQATIANIRMPTLLFVVWGFAVLAHYQSDAPLTSRDRLLRRLAIIVGLGVGHHPSMMFVVVGWVIYIALSDIRILWTPHRWMKPLLTAFCAWVIPQLYLPIRDAMADVVLSPGTLSTWRGFWSHVLARGFSGDMFAYATYQDLSLRLPLLPSLFRLQFPPIVILAMGIGWLFLLKWDRKFAIACMVSWLVHTFVTITYRAPQTIEYLMPAYVPMVLVFGVSAAASWAYSSRQHPLSRAIKTILVISLLSLGIHLIGTVPDFAVLAAEDETRNRIEPLLTASPEHAHIFADWRWATPLWTLQETESLNPTASVSYVYPEEPLSYEKIWRNRVDNEDEQPVFVTHRYAWNDWNFSPVGGGYRLYKRPLFEMPKELDYTRLEVDVGSIRLLGYRIVGTMKAGDSIELHLAWKAMQSLDVAPSFTSRLWDENGQLLSASDLFLGSDTEVDEIRFSQLTLQLPLDRCAKRVEMTLGVYTTAGGQFQDLGIATLTSLSMTCKYPTLPAVRPWLGYLTGGGPWVRGIDYDMWDDTSGVAYLHMVGPGDPLKIQNDSTQLMLPELAWGQALTAVIPVTNQQMNLRFSHYNGTSVSYVGLPFPSPRPGERYTPFGDKMVLISSQLLQKKGHTVVNLTWLTARPISTDYVVSTRLLSPDDSWQQRHDMQPGIGAIPTLKWVTTKAIIQDPHPFENLKLTPGRLEITIYDPFRMTSLHSPYGALVRYALP